MGSTRPPPINKSDVDGASAQGAEPGSWKDSGVVQGVTGFLVGVGFGVLPGGGVVEATATAVDVMDEGTPEARLGKSLGEFDDVLEAFMNEMRRLAPELEI